MEEERWRQEAEERRRKRREKRDKNLRSLEQEKSKIDTKKQFETLNLLPAGGSPADMGNFVKEETRRWSEVIHRAGIAPE